MQIIYIFDGAPHYIPIPGEHIKVHISRMLKNRLSVFRDTFLSSHKRDSTNLPISKFILTARRLQREFTCDDLSSRSKAAREIGWPCGCMR